MTNRNFKQRRLSVCRGADSQRGITIVELMISMVLSLILIGGVIQVVTTSQSSYRQLVQQARLQETAKLAMDYIVRDIRMVGYWGCNANNINIANSVEKSAASYFDPRNALRGYDVGSSTMPADVAGDASAYDDIAADTDIVEMRLLSVDNAYTVASHSPSSAVIHLTGSFSGAAGDIMTLVDNNCSNIGIFAATPGTGSGGATNKVNHNSGGGGGIPVNNCTKDLRGEFDCDNAAGSVGDAYSEGSSLYRVDYVAYGIQPSNFGAGINALWRIIPNEADIELVEGVEDLQVVYGLDTNADGVVDRFATAKGIEDDGTLNFQQAIVLRIDVTTRSLDEVSGVGVLAEDFSTSIRLRNRGI